MSVEAVIQTTRDTILGSLKTPLKLVPISAWMGGTVYVRELSGADFEDVIRALPDGLPVNQRLARLCALCACDSDGQLIFTLDDVPAILKGPLAPIIKVGNMASEINGLGDDSGN